MYWTGFYGDIVLHLAIPCYFFIGENSSVDRAPKSFFILSFITFHKGGTVTTHPRGRAYFIFISALEL